MVEAEARDAMAWPRHIIRIGKRSGDHLMDTFKKATPVKVGFLPTRRDCFDPKPAAVRKGRVEAFLKKAGCDYVGLDWLNGEGLIFSGLDADKVVERWRGEGVDAIFAAHCNFGTEDAVAKVANKLGLPLLVWGPRDEAPDADGYRMGDVQCGLFATTKVLSRFGVPFTYITNSGESDDVFVRGFDNFIRAATVVKSFRHMRVGQISTRPQAFWSVICNEGELLERFNIEVVPTTLVDISLATERLVKENGKELRETADGIKGKVSTVEYGDEYVTKCAALKLAIKDFALAQGLSAVGIQCWSALQKSLGIAPCFINGELSAEGLPVSCETDIHGAITSVMAQAASLHKNPTFFADLTVRHPSNDNSELLWHCGNFAHCLHKKGAPNAFNKHYDMFIPAAGDYELQAGDITVSRFDGMHGEYKLLFGHGKAVAGPMNKGTFVWFEVGDWPLWEEKIIYGPYIHHCTGIYGKYAPALLEACRYIPGLEPDPVDPTLEEIRKYLRG